MIHRVSELSHKVLVQVILLGNLFLQNLNFSIIRLTRYFFEIIDSRFFLFDQRFHVRILQFAFQLLDQLILLCDFVLQALHFAII